MDRRLTRILAGTLCPFSGLSLLMHRKRDVQRSIKQSIVLLGGLVLMATLMSAAALPELVPNRRAIERGCRDGLNPLDKALPEWVSVDPDPSDAPVTAKGTVRKSFVAREDNPFNHTSHDWNFVVVLDDEYAYLHSDANVVENGERLMDMEWEIKYFPPQFWPAAGDKVWMMGRWVFDCGEPDGGYKTEIHPPTAVAFTRLDPTILPGDVAPSLTNKTYIYIHGLGGYYNRAVGGRNYEFDIPLPPKPSPTAELRTQVLELPFGGPAPTLTPIPAANTVHVVVPLASIPASRNLKFGAVVAAGWREPVLTQAYRLLRVTFDSIGINNDHDPVFSGEWRLWVRASGNWLEVPGLDDVDDGDGKAINKSALIAVPENGALDIQTTGWENDCDGRFRDSFDDPFFYVPLPEDLECKIDSDDGIGWVAQQYAAPTFGVGWHSPSSVRNGDSDTAGDFTLVYHIDEVARFAPGTLTRQIVTVTFLSVKVVDLDNPNRRQASVAFDLEVNDQKRRFPAVGLQNVPLGSTVALPPGTSIAVSPGFFDQLRVRAFGDDRNKKSYERICDPDAHPHCFPPVYREVVDIYDRTSNFGQGVHTGQSPDIDGEYFEITYRIDVRVRGDCPTCMKPSPAPSSLYTPSKTR